MYRSHVLVCGGTGCSSSNSQQIIDLLLEHIEMTIVAVGFAILIGVPLGIFVPSG